MRETQGTSAGHEPGDAGHRRRPQARRRRAPAPATSAATQGTSAGHEPGDAGAALARTIGERHGAAAPALAASRCGPWVSSSARATTA
ncbi:hypothetical protein AB0F91_11630 [Amycolatopsis sp. NPDC023774]|uniref:hypothetical protein n=1 Tax=Amycolatopsis sp. NPDC023774 TaxID=3155015 RepID=UPI0033D343A2